jgi:hypothetical protein
MLAPGDPRHGKPSGYTYHGCRCDACRGAAVAANREWRAKNPNRNRGLEPGDARHGTLNGYTYHGCRCDACRGAAAAHKRERRAADPIRAREYDRNYARRPGVAERRAEASRLWRAENSQYLRNYERERRDKDKAWRREAKRMDYARKSVVAPGRVRGAYSAGENAFLIQNYASLTNLEMAIVLDRSLPSVRARLAKLRRDGLLSVEEKVREEEEV